MTRHLIILCSAVICFFSSGNIFADNTVEGNGFSEGASTDGLTDEEWEARMDSIKRVLYPPVVAMEKELPPDDEIPDDENSISPDDVSTDIVPTFSVSPNSVLGEIEIKSGVAQTGTRTYEVPVKVLPGMAGFTPSITLTYNSLQGNGLLGYGWNIGGLSAVNRTNKNIYFDGVTSGISMKTDDAFELDGIRLIRTGAESSYIFYQSETGNVRARAVISGNVTKYFEVFYPDGRYGLYGWSDNVVNKITYPLVKTTDLRGNQIQYTYKEYDNKHKYTIHRIVYNGAYVQFDYTDRNDKLLQYRGGVEFSENQLLSGIECGSGSSVVHKYSLTYTARDYATLLTSIGYSFCGSSLNPIKIYYGVNTPDSYKTATTQLSRWYSSEKPSRVRIERGKFDYMSGQEGIMMFPNENPYFWIYEDSGLFQHSKNYYENLFKGDEDILIYPNISGTSALPVSMKTDAGFIDVLTADIEGNQEEYLIKINNVVAGSVDRLTIKAYKAHIGGGLAQVYSRQFDSNTVHTDNGGKKSIRPKFFYAGDFDGDGRMEILAVTADKAYGDASQKSSCMIFDLRSGNIVYNGHMFDYTREFAGLKQNNADDIYNKTDKLFMMDYDGDGRTDICHIDKSGINIYSFTGAPGSLVPRKIATHSILNLAYLNYKDIVPGDYNGDGLTDFLVSPSKKSTDIAWKMLNSKGDGQWAMTAFNGNSHEEGSWFLSYDVNGDGVSDMIKCSKTSFLTFIAKNNKVDQSAVQINSFSTDNDLIVPVSRVSRNCFTQLLSFRVQNGLLTKFSFSRDDSQANMVSAVTTSLGVIETNKYLSITNASQQLGFYVTGSDAVFPYVNLKEPISVLMYSTKEWNGKKVENNTYNYVNAVLHRHGRGFMGFEKIITLGLESRNTTQVYEPYRLGLPLSYKDTYSEYIYDYSVTVGSNKIAKVHLDSKSETDLARGTTVLSTYGYDEYDNIYVENIKFRDGLTVQKINKYYNNAVVGQGYYTGIPQEVSVIKTRGNSTFTEKTVASSLWKGLPQTKQTYKNGSLEKTEIFTYDSNGNVLTEAVKMYGSSKGLTTKYSYSDNGLVIKKTYPIGTSEEYAYNIAGQVTSLKDTRGNSTVYSYNSNGYLKEINQPDGHWEMYYYSFGTDLDEGAYSVRKSYSKSPTETSVYDAFGRVIRTIETGLDGSEFYKDYEYNIAGTIKKESHYFRSGAQNVKWNAYSYDRYGRLTSLEEADSGRGTYYSYSGKSVTKTEDGVAVTMTYDDDGSLVKVTDSAGSVNYSLNANGDPLTITAPGNVITSYAYDTYGRCTSRTDPSFGKTTYAYDSEGNISKETDAAGNICQYSYDIYNRLVKETRSDRTVIRTYNSYGELTECSDENSSISYTYNKFGQLIAEKETYNVDCWFMKDYTYIGGEIYDIVYSSERGALGRESRRYSDSKHLNKITFGTSTILNIESQNQFRQPVKVITGPVTRNYTYTALGIPFSRNVKVSTTGRTVQNLISAFNPETLNLTSREDVTRGMVENFTYDALNRLTGWPGNTNAYDVKGNITSKSDIGTMQYAISGKPYAVSSVSIGENSDYGSQIINYNSFGMPIGIKEGTMITSFGYNCLQKRNSMTSKSGTILNFNRIYLGDCYERDIQSSGSTEERLYIGGDYYTAPAVLVKSGSSSKIYYILRDYLGSITHVVDEQGVVKQELSYDAWGNQRDPKTHNLISGENLVRSMIGDRGYTGHEHLVRHRLINMNARLYDPSIGRFLSPDPYIQDGETTQNFNRYSYCLNNPLKYKDENGEFFLFTIFNAVTDFFGNMFKHGFNVSQYSWKRTVNAWKIDMGMFKGNFGQVLNKWTYGIFNSLVGNIVSQVYNTVGKVDDVTYLDGMAALSGATHGNSAMTIGHYSLGPENYQASWTDNLFVHEYGHYIQSQQMGFWFFPIVALPSIASAAFTSYWSGMKHRDRWFEVDASNKGAKYFDKHYGAGKAGYTKNSEHYFDIDTFRNPNKVSPYVNKRFGSRYQSSHFPNTKGRVVIWDFML